MIDSHAHYDYIKFDGDREKILKECRTVGIEFVLNPAITIESNENMRKKLDEYNWIYYAVGIHPKRLGGWDSKKNYFWRDEIKKCIDGKKVIAIGETGLDYSQDLSESDKMQQKYWFRAFIDLGQIKKLPLVLHIRDAHQDAIAILREYPLKQSGVVHCFCGDLETARTYVEELGLYLGIGGKVTYPSEEALRHAVTHIPLERILLETDAPFVKPKDCYGKRNTSLNLPVVVKTIAQLKGISEKEVVAVTTKNVRDLFHITKKTHQGNIYLTGDTHCAFQRIETFCQRMQTTKEDVLIILGDAGVNYNGLVRDLYKKDFLSKLPITLLCVHGNHEQRPQTLPVYEEQQWRGGTVYVEPEYSNILFAKDGEIYDLNGQKAIVIGGAYSVDKMRRIAKSYGGNQEWWSDEQPSEEIKKYVEQQLELFHWNVDVVLSHTVPLKYEPVEVFLEGIDQSSVDKTTEEWLDRIEEKLHYNKWFAGHYHTEKKIDKLQLMFEDYTLL